MITLLGVLVMSAGVGADDGGRVATLSTTCFLDREDCRTKAHALEMLGRACERAESDLVISPYMPFLSFHEGDEEDDLEDFSELAEEAETYLAVALKERAGDKTYATSVLIDREGRVVHKWRKTHGLPDDDVDLGDMLEPYEADFGTIGATIGTDFYFPEIYEVLRMKGVEVLLWHHYPERFRDHSGWEAILLARCADSHAHLMTAHYADPRTYLTNRYEIGMQGTAFGRSMILNRSGIVLADTGGEDGVATAWVDLDKRKDDPYDPYVQTESRFFVNCMGDRTAFAPVAEPWESPELPEFKKRTARVAVIAQWLKDAWRNGGVPERMLELIDQAAELEPDLVLLSEHVCGLEEETVRRTCDMVAERARRMKAYIVMAGIRDGEWMSICHVWDREGNIVYTQPIYWPSGFPEITVFDTDFARIGTHVCGDLHQVMFDRVLALKGAELILDPSQMWGPSGKVNEALLQARALDNGVWIACAHWNSSDPGLRSVIVDPYGQTAAASKFQQDDIIAVDIDFDDKRVYYAGSKPDQPTRGEKDIPSYYSEDIPEQRPGWREMIFPRRRPEMYGIIPTVNDVIMKYRPEKVDN